MASPDYSSFLVNTPPVPQHHQQQHQQRSGSNSSGSSSSSRPDSSSLQQHQQQQQQQQQQSYFNPSSSSSNANPYAGYSGGQGSYGGGGQRGSLGGFPSSASSSTSPSTNQAFSGFSTSGGGQEGEGDGAGIGGGVASLGWNPDEVFGGGDLQFQLPSFLGPSSHAAPGGGVETFPNRSVGDWNNPSFNAGGIGGGDLMSGNGSGGTGGTWDAWNDSSLNFNSPPLKSYPPPAAAPIAPASANISSVPSPATILNQHQQQQPRERSYPSPSASSPSAIASNPLNFHLPAQPTEAAAFPTRSHLLPSGPTLATIPQVGKSMPGLYSTTGFDVLGVLSRVVGRANPRTVLGPVDFSCSFLVVDIRKFDCPIVYASPTFSNLTGYEGKDIVGKNCRFLQSPDGEVTKGSRRRYTDNVAVSHLQRQLSQGKECQASLINYRKGGVPFINLVTVIPIPWDTEEIVFHVGFQVDLVESPNAILRNIRDGTYQVNYASLNNPQLPLAPAGQIEYAAAVGNKAKTGLTSELLDVLGSKATDIVGEEALQTEWYKTIFDQSDDFIHVLSLKGQFLYVSPSVRRVLEYEPEDLANKNITDISHPSDHVPVMRALKDSTLKEGGVESSAVPIVNFLFRARRKTSGMVWIECTGRLHVEPGKGRKAVILCGRERVVPRLEWAAVARLGGVEEKDLWCSVSFDGLILYASASVTEALGVDKEDVVGSSLLDFVPSSEAIPPPVVLTSSANTSTPTLIEPPHARIQTALRSASQGVPKKSGAPVRHHIVVPASGGKPAMVHDVVTVFYSVDNSSSPSSSSRGWESGGSTSPWGPGSMMSGGEISPAASDATDSYSVEGGVGPSKRSVRATSVICQIKILSSTPKSATSPPAWTASATSPSSTSTSPRPIPTAPARPLTRSTGTDVFEEIEKTRGTGWQYELHQLKNDNRKLREQIAAAREAGPSSSSRRLSGGAGSYEPGRGKAIPKRKREAAAALPIAGPGPSSSAFALAPPPPPLHGAYSSSIRDPLPAPLIAAPAPPPSSSYQHLASYPYQAPQQQQQQQKQHYYQPQPQQQQQQQPIYSQFPSSQNFNAQPSFGGGPSSGGGAVGAGAQPTYAEYSNWMAMQARGGKGQGGGQQE
ncbi:PAS domain-containing protein [Mrakia frigida]|uniref:PAS domain-containing protein n=1 Tax=Mrakia frigida TaxID=29902 RepID=UPI003FCC0F10